MIKQACAPVVDAWLIGAVVISSFLGLLLLFPSAMMYRFLSRLAKYISPLLGLAKRFVSFLLHNAVCLALL